jgi:hypothetical protein
MTIHRLTSLPWRARAGYTLSTTLLLAGSVALHACADAGGSVDQRTDSTHDEIIGGVDADSAALDAVGSLAAQVTVAGADGGESSRYLVFCSASLIGNATAMTAKHCIRQVQKILDAGFKVYFGIGADGRVPKRKIEVLDIAGAPLDKGGWPTDMGSDVGVVHLAEEVRDVALLKFESIDGSPIGTHFVSIGYGQQDIGHTSGTRKAGTETLHGLSGKVFELRFGDFGAFATWADAHLRMERGADAGADASISAADRTEILHRMYDESTLLPGYQALVGGQPGDAQPCFGDSGGPIVRRVGDDLVGYGVASTILPSDRLQCDYGTVYATFGPATYAFLAQARLWSDPCAGMPSGGACEGTVAARCMPWSEGPRRVTRIDCAAIGQACGVDDGGNVACVDRNP